MTTHAETGPRRPRLRAKLIGLGFDGADGLQRIITGKDYLVVGGSEETHAEMLETLLRLESELESRGQGLGEVPPNELAEIAYRIDSPDLVAIAVRLTEGLEDLGRSFFDTAADELTKLAFGRDLEPVG